MFLLSIKILVRVLSISFLISGQNRPTKLFLEIFDAFLYVLSQITTSEGDMLINEVTKTEAFQALQSLPSSKSPRPDSLNAKYIGFTEMILEMLFFPAIR